MNKLIEEIVYSHLLSVMQVPVSFEVPVNVPDSLVVVEKISSSMDDGFLETATLAVQSYAKTMLGAAQLNSKVKEAMRGLISSETVTKVSLNSDYNFTDTSTGRYRYQAVFDVTYYAR